MPADQPQHGRSLAQGQTKTYTPLLEQSHPTVRMRRRPRPYVKRSRFPLLAGLSRPREESQALTMVGLLLVIGVVQASVCFVLWEAAASGGVPATALLTEAAGGGREGGEWSHAAALDPSAPLAGRPSARDEFFSLGRDSARRKVRYFVLR